MNGIQVYTEVEGKLNDALIIQYAPLVKRIAHHLMCRLPSNILVDDLIQSGMIGLLEATKNYDPSKGASFETYASIRIRGMMLDEVRKGDWTPRSVHRNARMVSEAIRTVELRTGRDAKDSEVAEEMGVSITEYNQMVQDSSCSRLFGFEDLRFGEELISEGLGKKTTDPFEGIQQQDFREKIVSEIANLPEREQLVLSLYYDEELNLREIGDVLEVSESRVSQIHAQAMCRLRARVGEWHNMHKDE